MHNMTVWEMEYIRLGLCDKNHELNQQMGYRSIYTLYPDITVLTAMFRSGSPLQGTMLICENMSALWQKCPRVPCRVT
jgi:hypothetical protein